MKHFSAKSMAVAAALALSPAGASAISLDPANNISNGGSYNVLSGPFFWDATFSGGDGAGSVSFTFGNPASAAQTVGVTQGTVLQFSGQFNGVTVSWGNGTSQTVAPGVNAIINVSSILASGASDVLTVSWGAVTGSRANIDLDIQAVPLPATLAMLLTALLAGVGLKARSRKSA